MAAATLILRWRIRDLDRMAARALPAFDIRILVADEPARAQVEIICSLRFQKRPDARFSTLTYARIFRHNALRVMVAVVHACKADLVALVQVPVQFRVYSVQVFQGRFAFSITRLVRDEKQ